MRNFLINSITFLVEFLISLTILLNGYSVRKNIVKTILWGLLCFSAFFCLYYFAGITVLNIIATFVFIFIFSLAGFKTTIKELIVNSVSISVTELISEFICMAAFSSVGDMELLNTDLNHFVVWTAASKIVYLSLGTILIYFFRKLKDRKLNLKSSSPIYLFLYPLCTTFATFVYWIVLANNEISRLTKIYISSSVILLSVAVIATYAFYAYTEERNIEINELQNELDKIRIDKEYYKLLDFQSEHIRRMAHDEKNHLLVIKGMSDNAEINSYIDQIYDDLQTYSYSGATENRQLDVLLNKYKIQCDAEKISFQTNIVTADFSRLSDTDLVSLMSNILDNAIDSAKNSQERRIRLSMNKAVGTDAIVCVNSCDTPPKTVDGKLVTSKHDQKHHGYGSKIIEDIAKKYGGCSSFRYDEEKKEFTLTVAL
ncbi:MAG: GHKL domain-containing protein [Clostridia bacterium]|nr:GHKL domain-containing protein [Clostridia bacterium]